MFADNSHDTNVFINHKHIKKVYKTAQLELNNIFQWISANKLSLEKVLHFKYCKDKIYCI